MGAKSPLQKTFGGTPISPGVLNFPGIFFSPKVPKKLPRKYWGGKKTGFFPPPIFKGPPLGKRFMEKINPIFLFGPNPLYGKN